MRAMVRGRACTSVAKALVGGRPREHKMPLSALGWLFIKKMAAGGAGTNDAIQGSKNGGVVDSIADESTSDRAEREAESSWVARMVSGTMQSRTSALIEIRRCELKTRLGLEPLVDGLA